MALEVLTVRQTVARLNQDGLPISEYAVRLLVKQGKLPARFVGQKALLFYPRVLMYFQCADGADNTLPKAGQ